MRGFFGGLFSAVSGAFKSVSSAIGGAIRSVVSSFASSVARAVRSFINSAMRRWGSLIKKAGRTTGSTFESISSTKKSIHEIRSSDLRSVRKPSESLNRRFSRPLSSSHGSLRDSLRNSSEFRSDSRISRNLRYHGSYLRSSSSSSSKKRSSRRNKNEKKQSSSKGGILEAISGIVVGIGKVISDGVNNVGRTVSHSLKRIEEAINNLGRKAAETLKDVRNKIVDGAKWLGEQIWKHRDTISTILAIGGAAALAVVTAGAASPLLVVTAAGCLGTSAALSIASGIDKIRRGKTVEGAVDIASGLLTAVPVVPALVRGASGALKAAIHTGGKEILRAFSRGFFREFTKRSIESTVFSGLKDFFKMISNPGEAIASKLGKEFGKRLAGSLIDTKPLWKGFLEGVIPKVALGRSIEKIVWGKMGSSILGAVGKILWNTYVKVTPKDYIKDLFFNDNKRKLERLSGGGDISVRKEKDIERLAMIYPAVITVSNKETIKDNFIVVRNKAGVKRRKYGIGSWLSRWLRNILGKKYLVVRGGTHGRIPKYRSLKYHKRRSMRYLLGKIFWRVYRKRYSRSRYLRFKHIWKKYKKICSRKILWKKKYYRRYSFYRKRYYKILIRKLDRRYLKYRFLRKRYRFIHRKWYRRRSYKRYSLYRRIYYKRSWWRRKYYRRHYYRRKYYRRRYRRHYRRR